MQHHGVADRAFREALSDPLSRARADREGSLSRYARDPFAHLEDGHIRILDLETLEEVPLDPWPHQRTIAADYIDLERLAETGRPSWRNIVLPKSRQMGITWFLAYLDWWALNYHSAPAFYVHIKGGEVDDGGSRSTPDSYFGKIRFMHENYALPEAHRPPLQFIGGNDPVIRHAYRPQAYLAGMTATSDPGRGQRYAHGILDESARVPWGESVQAALSRACPQGRAYVSTPDGKDNLFYRLVDRTPSGYLLRRLHWSEHPVYSRGLHQAAVPPDAELGETYGAGGLPDCALCEGVRLGLGWNPMEPVAHRYPGRLTSPWYDAAVEELTDEQVAAELEIDFEGSVSGRVYPGFSEAVHVESEKIEIEPAIPLEMAWDFGIGPSPTTVVVCQETPYEFRVVAEYEAYEETPEEVSRGLRAALVAAGLPPSFLSREQTLAYQGWGDPAAEARSLATGRPLIADYRDQGWAIATAPAPIARTIIAVRRLLIGRPKPLKVSPTCPLFIEHVKANRWPTDRHGNLKPSAVEPLNDRHNHMLRGFSYLIVNKFPPPETEDSIRDATTGGRQGSGRISEALSYDMQL